MKRKMIGAAAAYMSGLFFASFFTDKLILIFAVTAVGAMILKKFTLRDFTVIIFFFSIAFFAGNFYTVTEYDQIILYDGETGEFSGEITDIKIYEGDSALYVLKGEINGLQSAKVRFYSNELDAEYGDTVIIPECSFSRITGDYLFDSENYYKSMRVFLSVSGKNIAVQKNNSEKIKNFLVRYRERMISEFRISLGEDCGNFLAGMVFGERQGIDDNLKTALCRSGIGHILAVSGLHVSIISSLLILILKRLNINRFVSFVILNIFIILLIIMANSPVSAIRAAVMLDFLYSARLFLRQNDTFNSLAAASLIICIANPYAVYSSGFMLSLSGTFGTGVLAPYMTKNLKKETAFQKFLIAVVSAVCTTVSVMPLSIVYFDETSLISPVMNILAVPLCTAAMIAGVIYILTAGVLPVLPITGILIKPVICISERLAGIGLFHIPADEIPENIIISLGAVAVLIFFVLRSRKITVVVISICFAVFSVFCTAYGFYRRNKLIVSVLGRGTNAAAVVSYMEMTAVIDLSGHYRSAGYVRKYLTVNGIDRIDAIILNSNIQSQYAAYMHELEFFPADNVIVSGNTPVTGRETLSGDFGFTYDTGYYAIDSENGIISVSCGEDRIFFDSAKSVKNPEGFTVYYGNIPKNSEIAAGNIYLDSKEDVNYEYSGMNNFEIILDSGDYRIRRL